ncbi:MAG: hypothetical protein JJU10_09820 [Idiomarina sp.]|nr:hypothetical protein [Idiomarina sp.]
MWPKALSTFLSLSALALVVSGCAQAPDAIEGGRVSVDEDAIVLDGPATAATVRELLATAEANPNIRTFRVRSDAGDPMAAMQWGYHLYRNEFNLEVWDYCLDSCSNYFFTAAHRRVLQDNAIVAWSGGAMDESWVQQLRFYIFPGIRNVATQYLDAFLRRETRFFDRINVDQRIVSYGFDDHVGCMTDSTRGFYYGVADLLALGIGRTSREGVSWDRTFRHMSDEWCEVELDPLQILRGKQGNS